MIRATSQDKGRVTDILARSFDNNQSVNYVIPQDRKRKKRIEVLMNYSFDICHAFGEVFLSDDRNASAMVLFPDKRKTTLKSVSRDVKLILFSMGIANVKKALQRESLIKDVQPKELMCYLWFIGVDPGRQHLGIGSQLLSELIEYSNQIRRPVFLETSTQKNLPWYEKFGFNVYSNLDLGYMLYFMKRECNNFVI